MATLGDLIIKIGGNVDGYKAAMTDASATTDAFATKVVAQLNSTGTIFDAYGRQVTAATDGATASVERLAVAETAGAAAAQKLGAAHARSVNEIQATSAALRVLEGNGGLRAGERFIASTIGLGPALQGIFPIVGAIAFAEILSVSAKKLYEFWQAWDPIAQAEKRATEEIKQYDKELAKVQQRLAAVRADQNNLALGKPQGEALTATQTPQNDINKLRAQIELQKQLILDAQVRASATPTFGSQGFTVQNREAAGATRDVETLSRDLQILQAQLEAAQADQQKIVRESLTGQASERASFRDIDIKSEEEHSLQLDQISLKRAEAQIGHDQRVAQARIEALRNPFQRAIEIANAEVETAQQRADRLGSIYARETSDRVASLKKQQDAISPGETDEQAARRRSELQLQIQKTEDEGVQRQLNLEAEATAAQDKANTTRVAENRKAWEQITEEARKSLEEITASTRKFGEERDRLITEDLAEKLRVIEIQDRGEGQQAELRTLGGKLVLERQYGLSIIQTAERQIAYARQIADIEQKARLAKISGLQAELNVLPDEGTGTSDQQTKRAEVEQQIAQLRIQSANADYQAQTKILELEKQRSILGQVGKAVGQVPGALGNSLSAGIFSGKGIGQEIANSLKGIGQQMLGGVFTRMISSLVANTAAHFGLTAATTAHTGILAAHLGVMGAHLGVMATHLGVMIVHTATMILNTVSTIANTVATLIQAAVSFFGFADGGDPPVGVPSIVGERGPELFIPKNAGTIIPNHALKAFAARGSVAGGSISSSSSTLNSGGNTFHFHGVQNVQEMMRAITRVAKNANPRLSPAAS